ncbi:uncharacterized protein LOC135950574 [Calliphora vicina]|uniref:uncharacterized protein LOC135950574 n=1 Tax=Calliphora vicina TaxID=7373 RepID=UPI00325BF660
MNKYNIDICLLCEIFNFADDNSNARFINHNILMKKRSNNSFGGVAIMVSKHISITQVPFSSSLEVIICETKNLSKNLTLASVYVPQSVKAKQLEIEMKKLLIFLDTKQNVILGGDFNARSQSFGDSINSPRGNSIRALIDDSGFHPLNDGNITFKASLVDPHCHGSVLDLTFTNTFLNMEWNVMQSTIGAQAIKQFQKDVKIAKRKSFVEKTEELNNIPGTKSFFRFINACRSSSSHNTHSKWNPNNNLAFLEHLKGQATCQITLPNFTMDDPFTNAELLAVLLNKTKSSAAGPDNISYEMLRSLSTTAKHSLLLAFNNLWKQCVIRDSWRQIRIAPIPKVNKDLDNFTNFRPIALISVLVKTINLMLKERITNFLSENNILPMRSYAYRKHRSASCCINDLLHAITVAKEANCKVTLVTLDISRAYDCVKLDTLHATLGELNMPLHWTSWIYEFLRHRVLILGNSKIDIFNGLPQGSCLSPLLFNIYTLKLHQIADEDTQIFQFADDFVIMSTHRDFDTSVHRLQNKLNLFHDISKSLNLHINYQKTAALYMAKGTKRNVSVFFNNNPIMNVNCFKFLGRYIKNSLSLKEHYDSVVEKSKAACNAIKMVTSFKGGLMPNIAINLSKSLVFSKTEYARSSTAHAPRSLGLNPSTPTHIIYALSLTLPPSQRALYLAAKELLKMKMFNPESYRLIAQNPTRKSSLGHTYLLFKNIFENTCTDITPMVSAKISISLNNFPSSKNNTPIEVIRSFFCEKIHHLKSEGYAIFATDASVMPDSTGCAVCNISCNHNFMFRIPNKVSSLTGELYAIDKAIDIIIEDGYSQSAIFTDSKNACLLLRHNTSFNFLVSKIIKKIENSNLNSILFIWTPAHVGIPPNELADYFAKHAASAGCIIRPQLSLKDAYAEIYKLLWNQWDMEYKTQQSGRCFHELFPELPKSHWFSNSNLSKSQIKIINRLLTGHTFNKPYLKMIGSIASDLCEICNVIDDDNHAIFHCTKFNYQRQGFAFFSNYNSLMDLLKTKKLTLYKELLSFINICDIEL